MRQRHLPGSACDYEEDHFIPLELGGHPTGPRNLGPEHPPDLRSRVLRDLGQVSPVLAASIMQAGMSTDGSESLAQLRCPLLMVSARAPVDIERLRGLQPEALIGRVVGSGHWLTLAVPDQVNAMLDRFLELATPHG